MATMWFPLNPHSEAATKNAADQSRPHCKRLERLAKLAAATQSSSDRSSRNSTARQSKRAENTALKQPVCESSRRISVDSRRSVEIQSEDMAVTIKDLCEGDRQRIAELIREIAKMTNEKRALESAFDVERDSRRSEIEQTRVRLAELERDRHALQHQVTEYQRLLCESQKQVLAHFNNEQALASRIDELMAQMNLRSRARDADSVALRDELRSLGERRRRSKSSPKRERSLHREASPQRNLKQSPKLSSPHKRHHLQRPALRNASTNTSLAEEENFACRRADDRGRLGHSLPSAIAFATAVTSSPRAVKPKSAFALRDSLLTHRVPPKVSDYAHAQRTPQPLKKYADFDAQLLESLISDADDASQRDVDVVSDCLAPCFRDRVEREGLAQDRDDELLSDLFFLD